MRELDAKAVGHFDKLLGGAVPVPTQSGHSAYPTETFSTAAYEMSTFPVTRAQGPKSSAVSSILVGPQASKPSTGSTSKPEVIVSRTTMQPEPLANRSTPSYFTDGPKSFGEGLAPGGKGLEDITGSMSDLEVPSTSLGTKAAKTVDDEDRKESPTQSTLLSSRTAINLLKKNSTSNDRLLPSSDQWDLAITQVTENSTVGFSTLPQRVDSPSPPNTHASTNGSKTNSVKTKGEVVSVPGEVTEAPLSTQANAGNAFSKSSSTLSRSVLPDVEKRRGEATTPSPEVPLPFLARYRSHIIVFLGFAFCIYLAITGVCAKSRICIRASPMEMVQGITYSKIDPQSNAYSMQVL